MLTVRHSILVVVLAQTRLYMSLGSIYCTLFRQVSLVCDRTRQMQNVPVNGKDRSISSDHTFDTAKNFLSEEGMPNPEMVLFCCYPFSLALAGMGHGDWTLEGSDCPPHTHLRR